MSRKRVFEIPWQLVLANSTTGVVVPVGPYEDTAGMKKARASGEARGRNGLAEGQFTLQWANVESTPLAATTLGTNMDADGHYPPTAGATDVSTSAAQYSLVRPAITAKLTSGSTTGWIWVGGRIEVVDMG